jgi:hypothetical protein
MNKQGQLLSVVRSPWILTTIPLLLGGMWLILHPTIITDNLDKPYALLAGPALVGSILAGWFVLTCFKTISSWCKSTWTTFIEWKKKEGSSFWLVIYVFLAISVLESGTFFGYLLGSNSFFGTLGYASAFAIDLVAVECMRARLNAVRMRNKRGAIIHLFGLTMCAVISTFANGFTALFHWHAPEHTAIPALMIQIAPVVGVIFPLLMIFLSLAGDYTADQISTKLDPEEYRKSEQKRIDLIEIQRDMLRSRLQIEQEIDQMTHRLKGGKSGRTFFLIAWLFPRDPLSMQAVVTAVTEEVRKTYDAQFATLNQQISTQIRQLGNQSTQSTLQFQKEIQSTLSGIQTDHKTLATQQSATGKQLSILTKQIELIAESNERFQDEIEPRLSATVSEQIATVLQSYNLPDETTIAEQIATAIQEYTVDQTDDNSTPIDSQKPLYRLLTEDLKQVIERFPMIDSWIRRGQRTVSVSDIVQATGFTSQFIGRQASDRQFTRINTDNLKVKTDSIYNTKSVINWLKTNPSPQKRSTKRREQNTEEINTISQQDLQNTKGIPAAQNGHTKFPKQTVKLDEYAELVGVM